MATVVNIFSHTIGRKLIMALTGGFLIIFLIGHLAGNLVLFAEDSQLAFNEYTKFMTTNPFVKVLSYLTYISIVLHVIYSVILTRKNRESRPVKYAYNKPAGNSSWNSRNMGLLGLVVLLFLIIHLRSFWFELKFGSVPMMAGTDLKDLHTVVMTAFSELWYVALYVLAMAGLAYHLDHGFQSAFQTLGLNHKAYTPVIKNVGRIFSIAVPAVFALIPIYTYLTQNNII
jgi:succinate dehydrogenase / fumarate reductase cytochrome b subunit